jgi:hypothetical protein
MGRRTKDAHLSDIDGSNYGWGAGSHLLRRFPAIASLEYSSERKKEECSGATAAERGKEGKAEEDEAVRRSTT